MNGAHLHLIVNHIPVMGTMFGLIFLIIAIAGRNRVLIKASLWILFIVAILTVPAYLTGSSAEKVVENLPGISEDIIREHEESAEQAFIAVIIWGLMAAGGLLLYRVKNRVSGVFLATIALIGIITGVLMAGAANKGGDIRHSEIRTETTGSSDTSQYPLTDTENDNE